MKIAFVGKGGSGKTTVASLFAGVAASDDYAVLACDADINQHLAAALGYNGHLRSMGMESNVIKQYLRPDIAPETMHKTTPPGHASRLFRLASDDWFIREFATYHHGVWLAGAGDIPEGNVGVRCYHGLNGAVEMVLGHLIDQQNDIVLVDMTAGADAFSSSLFTKVDTLVLVVEPTLKSLAVYAQFMPHGQRYDVPIIVVGNKVQDDSDKQFILDSIPGVQYWISQSSYVRQRERGQAATTLEPEAAKTLRELRSDLLERPIDWHKREQLAHAMHRRAVNHPTIDPDFSLADAIL